MTERLRWRTASVSGGGDCVEVAWRTASTSAGGECVEVAADDDAVLVRHSKDPDGPRLSYTPTEWAAFVSGVKDGEFDF
jgi:hypothetical protein